MVCVDIVIESHLLPSCGHMAAVALLTKMTVMIVVFSMTADARRLHRVAERVVAVTVATAQFSVPVLQRKIGVTVVIETRVIP